MFADAFQFVLSTMEFALAGVEVGKRHGDPFKAIGNFTKCGIGVCAAAEIRKAEFPVTDMEAGGAKFDGPGRRWFA